MQIGLRTGARPWPRCVSRGSDPRDPAVHLSLVRISPGQQPRQQQWQPLVPAEQESARGPGPGPGPVAGGRPVGSSQGGGAAGARDTAPPTAPGNPNPSPNPDPDPS